MSGFEVFRKGAVTPSGDLLVTLQRRGSISLNRAAFLALGEPDAVELLFDSDAEVIGLRAIDSSAPHACYVRTPTGSESGPYLVTAIAFLRFYGIEVDRARRWQARLRDDILCVDLTEAGTEVSSNRAKPSAADGGTRR
jgi:hypothetical protein